MDVSFDPEFEQDLAYVAGEKEPELFTPAWWVAGYSGQSREMTWRDWVRKQREAQATEHRDYHDR
jgi:hypothetical protein